MTNALERRLEAELEQFIRDGVYKRLNYLEPPQGAAGEDGGPGRSHHPLLQQLPRPVRAARGDRGGKAGLDRWGAGTASVRFICGTFTVHRELENACARLVGTPASLSFVSAWNANEAVPATLLGEEDIVISDQLNHASIIDGVRLAKAITKCQTAVYKHSDLADLEAKLTAARDRRVRLVITDGVFSMEGAIARLPDLLEICRKHRAVLVVDDSHGPACSARPDAARRSTTGSWATWTSSPRRWARRSAARRVASSRRLGGRVRLSHAARPPAALLQRAPPTVAASSLASIEYLEAHPERVTRLREQRPLLPRAAPRAGFKPLPGETPIIPVILGETSAAIRMSDLLLAEGVFVTGFGYPVVPQGQARVRCQISAAHTRDDLDEALAAFAKVGRQLGLI